ncbi:MAG: sulfotransferase domain-containing protein [Alphaproteobacteria bacterium]|nr:sulfotransferase domain-containing protein [Alphaproteobacteria bacterium]
MTLPAFFIAGASFSGAEILQTLLKENPALFFPQGKPSAFFYRSDLYAAGTDKYQTLFHDCDPHRLPGDTGIQYFERGIVLGPDKKYLWQPQEDCAFRIKKHCPDAKIIICLRNPLARAATHFEHAKAASLEKTGTLADALQEEKDGKRTPENHPLCYLYRNKYSEHVAHWKRLFGAGNLLIVLYENLIADTENELTRIAHFLSIRPHALDKLSILKAKSDITPFLSKIFEFMDRFPSLKPVQLFFFIAFAEQIVLFRKPG